MSKSLQPNKVYFTWQDFDKAVIHLTKKVSRGQYKDIFGIPRGGQVLAVALSHRLGIPLAYEIGRKTLVCDDINDSGETLSRFKSKEVAVIHSKRTSSFKDKYCYRYVKRNEWIVYPWELKNSLTKRDGTKN